MEKAIERGEFVEYAKVHTNMYGTSIEAVRKVLLFHLSNEYAFPRALK
jgi:guanylate kinase